MTSTISTAASRPSVAATRGGSGRAPPAMPIQARRTRPSRISAPTIWRVVALIGTASPRPTPATAVLMPTTRPAAVDQRAARVAGVERGVGLDDVVDDAARRAGAAGSERPSADTTAGRHRPAKPCGLPIATTSWPTRRPARRRARPAGAGRVGAQHREVRQRVAADTRTSHLAAVRERRAHALAVPATTCAEVSRNPSGRDHDAGPPPPGARRGRETRRLATDGRERLGHARPRREYASSASASSGSEPGAEGASGPGRCRVDGEARNEVERSHLLKR
jgi:hypothetical protein